MPRSAAAFPAALRRRTLLTGGVAVAAGMLAGCETPIARAPDPTAKELSFRTLSEQESFFIGTRGGSRDWPELTAYGFERAAAIPEIQSMELVVRSTADRVLICWADQDTKRLTGKNLTVEKSSWAALSKLSVSAHETKDPGQPAQPIARLDDIIDRYIDRFVLVVEPIGNNAVSNTMARLIALQAPGRVVWKQPVNSNRFGEAKLHGFATWGYVLNEPAHTGSNLTYLAQSADLDMIGVSLGQKKSLVSSVVEAARRNQKVAAAYNVHSRGDASRAIKLGFRGLASPAIREAVRWTA